jgi:hypothetical protein
MLVRFKKVRPHMPTLVLVGGMPRYQQVNEVEALMKALKLMKQSWGANIARSLHIKLHVAEDKEDFLRWLEKQTDFLHISCHGESRNGVTELYVMRAGTVSLQEIEGRNIQAKVVFINACQASRKKLAEAFLVTAGKRRHMYLVAPFNDVYFDEAFLASLFFYKREFIERSSHLNQTVERKSLNQTVEYINNLLGTTTTYRIWEKISEQCCMLPEPKDVEEAWRRSQRCGIVTMRAE